MKKVVQAEKHFCDFCEDEAIYPEACMECGKEFCYECTATQGRSYQQAVPFSGSEDGYYCNACDSLLSTSGDNPLYVAYQNIQSLRFEEATWHAIFQKRATFAEDEVKRLRSIK